jgi:hypothetical protein
MIRLCLAVGEAPADLGLRFDARQAKWLDDTIQERDHDRSPGETTADDGDGRASVLQKSLPISLQS